MRIRKSSRKGNAMIEFTLVGIPMIFVLISTFEMARGMWLYHTLAHAVKEATRYAIVHSNNCNVNPSSCASRIRDIALRMSEAGVGLIPEDVQNVTFISVSRAPITCPTLQDCLQSGGTGDVYWPAAAPGAAIDVGGERGARVQITAEFPFRSAIAMLWPGAGGGINFPIFVLPANSEEVVQY